MAEKQPRKRRTKVESIPLMATGAAAGSTEATRVRRNVSSTIEALNRFSNINDGLIPFTNSSSISSASTITVRDAVVLCQKCYYNFSTFRNVVDLMTEFSASDIYFKGGTKKSRDFFKALFNKIGLADLQDKFFREYYRSGNVFIYRFDAKLRKGDVKKITQLFGEDNYLQYNLPVTKPAKISKLGEPPNVQKMVIPTRYVILNPADIHMHGAASFAEGRYSKVLTNYELERLKKPYTEEDREVLNSLDSKTKEALLKRGATQLLLPLDVQRMIAVFYKKQSYEPFAVPMGFPVLDDINFKAEMKKMDMAVLRTMQQCILLVTMGAEPEKGGINQKNLAAMQRLFENESVGRVLISDYTTKAEFVIPKVADLLDPKKYEVIDGDINLGLNNILFGGEKFSNQGHKIDVFLRRLDHARNAFLNDFLIPEIKRIAKNLGFRSYPTPHFDKVFLKDAFQMGRLWNQLAQFGLLTPEEVMEAHRTGRLPDPEESELSQEMYKKLRDKGFYEPVTGGPNSQLEIADKQSSTQLEVTDKTAENQLKLADKNAKSQQKLAEQKVPAGPSGGGPTPAKKPKGDQGRPPGPGVPRKPSPPGQGPQTQKASAEEAFSMEKIKNTFILADKLHKQVEKALRAKHKIKRLNKTQKEVASQLTEFIMGNEDSEDWLTKVGEYCENPRVINNNDIFEEVSDIAYNHQVDSYLASVLRASKAKD